MTNVHASTRRSEQGFTLVELAIVMVIIGLLIGGILKGQELIANAKISGTVTQIKGLDAAMNTFQDKYNALAGDMNNVENRLPGGLAAESGTGNGRIDAQAGAAPTATSEGILAFKQLSRADLISGIDTTETGAPTIGRSIPAVKAGGGMWLGSATAAGGATGLGAATLNGNRIYAALNGSNVAVAAAGASGVLTPSAAAQIDRKIDDGVADRGSVQSSCTNGVVTNGTYNEGVQNGSCSMFTRILN